MIYSDLYVPRENKFPTVVGVVVVLLFTAFFSNIFFNPKNSSQASLKVAKRVEIVNLSPSQVSIFWQTNQSESGWVAYGESEASENTIVLDDKDLSNIGDLKGKYNTHLATLKELTPGKKYFFRIITDNNKIIVQPDGKSFSFETPQDNLNIIQNISPAFGKVLKSNSIDPLTDSYILLTVKGGYSLLTQIKSSGDGSWLIPLNQIYSKDSKNILTISEKDLIIIEVITNEGESLTITTLKSKVSPLPQTTIFIKDKNYSFVSDDNVLSASSNFSGPVSNQVDVLYPKEGSLVPGTIPLIKGMALPLAKIEITVGGRKSYSAIVTSDSQGIWSYLLPESLNLGPHTIVIKTRDTTGNDLTLTRKFTMISQQGNEGRVLGTATGEPTITTEPTAAPTIVINNTPMPSLTPIRTTTPPVTGSNYLGTVFGSLSLIVIGGGILLAF